MAKVLVVDDSEFILGMLSEYLSDGGYEVMTANDGMKAMALMRRSTPDVIIMDIMMPGMDGHSVSKLIKLDKNFEDIPIIVFSERGGEKDVSISAGVGASLHLKKGATQDEVLQAVASALRERV